MSDTVVLKDLVADDPHSHESPGDPYRVLRHAIEHAAHLLPAQGPITVFIHHNTLHAFEDLPFDRAVEHGARVFGCQPYLTEDQYREALRKGRIGYADLLAVIEDELGLRAVEGVARLVNRLDLRLAMLQYPLRTAPAEEILWFMAQTDALRRFNPDMSAANRAKLIAETRRWVMRDLRGGNGGNGRPPWVSELFERFGESEIESWREHTWEAFTLESLWNVCRDGVRGVPSPAPTIPPPIRHRDLLLSATGVDTDSWVHDVLIRFSAAFLDQGISHWSLPDRDRGFYHAFCSLYRRPGGPPNRWMHGLAAELARLQDTGVEPIASARESLEALGVPECEWGEFIAQTLLALRGWGGMMHQVEVRGDRVSHPIPPGSLIEFVAVRLLLERFALAHAAVDALGFTGPLASLRDELHRRVPSAIPASEEQRAFLIFQIAQVLGWSPNELDSLTAEEWRSLLGEVEGFDGVQRRRVFHLAYERRFRDQCLDALARHTGRAPMHPRPPRFQAIFCIDEREESIRRHLEEVAPEAETLSIAGFFGVAMYFRGAASAHYVPLCPAVIQPTHWVTEEVVGDLKETHRRRAKARRALGSAMHQFEAGSRTFALGAFFAAVLGLLATIPLVARILFPRLTARIRKLLGQFVRVPPVTRLKLERTDSTPGPEGEHVGFTLDEMVGIAERLLRDTGLTHDFARLVLIVGHGSTSLNNPHESAHDCGACGGAVGGPNARAMARILNDPRVREVLASRGVTVPAETVFVGGLHNTSSASITFFASDLIPESHRAEFEAVHALFESACDRDAHERCRRFESAPLTLSFADARRHVESRAEDLAQVRPEWGHATNALCVVGRRERTRGLYLDRRAFLNSYDPTQDDAEGTILARILAAAVPVCGGISLEYYFSYVDSPGYGCGTKLPHNITSLLGVMDGAASDLRTGLPWQMVEIHEPVRILFIVETTPAILMKVMDRNETIGRMVRNGWVQLATLDPHSDRVQVFRDSGFHEYRPRVDELPQAASSVDWYRGWRGHLEFAEIGGMTNAPPMPPQ